ncbi:MAG: large conductance mechanosensitive channel protein MscL [Leptolyngbyaceae cyanobacterium]
MVSRQARSRTVNSVGGFMHDFKEFLMRGNVVDLAVAVVIGAAFGAIINSFIADIITPLILNPALQAAGVDDIAGLSAGGIKYGLFLAAILNFVVIAFALFVIIRIFERMKRKEAVEEAAEPSIEEKLNVTLAQLTEVIERKL